MDDSQAAPPSPGPKGTKDKEDKDPTKEPRKPDLSHPADVALRLAETALHRLNALHVRIRALKSSY